MKQEALNLLKDFYNNNEEEIVSAIIVGGSTTLPYINNNRDIDVFIVFKNCANKKEIGEQIFQLQMNVGKEDSNVTVMARYLDVYKHWLDENYELPESLADKSDIPTYAYLFRFGNVLCGEDVAGITNIDILQDGIKQRYISNLKNRVASFDSRFQKHHKLHKSIYHFLTGLYILKNNSYDLTQEQINNINIVHDQENQEKILELYNWVLKEVDAL